MSRRTVKRGIKKRRSKKRPKRMTRAENLRIGGYIGLENKFKDTTLIGWLGSGASQATREANQDELWHIISNFDATKRIISGVAQGDGGNQRDGRKYLINQISIRGCVNSLPVMQEFVADSYSNVSENIIRILLVQDKCTNNSTYDDNICSNIMKDNTDTFSFRNLEESSRFNVLASTTLHLQPQASSVYDSLTYIQMIHGNNIPFEFNKKVHIPVLTNGTTDESGSITDNSIFLIACQNSAVYKSNVEFTSRIRYTG